MTKIYNKVCEIEDLLDNLNFEYKRMKKCLKLFKKGVTQDLDESSTDQLDLQVDMLLCRLNSMTSEIPKFKNIKQYKKLS